MITGLITIYIPTKNRHSLVKRALNSVFSQTYSNYEVIVVDDGSDDGTLEWSHEVQKAHKQLKVITFGESRGACVARNAAIAIASGEFITGLDDDDYFQPNRLSELISSFNPDFAFVSTSQKICRFSPLEFSFKHLLSDNLAGNQFFTFTERVKAVGGFDDSLRSAQDLDLMVRLCLRWGSAHRIKSPSYVLDTDHQFLRISNSSNKIIGMKQFYNKHAHHMTLFQKLHYLLLIKRWQKSSPLFRPFVIFGLIITNPIKIFRVLLCRK